MELGTALILLCAVALTENIVIGRNVAKCHCDPAQAAQICQENYDKSDVLVAHEYCNKFYLCIDGKPYTYDCPPNLMFDPVKEQCDQPGSVNCGGRLIVVVDDERYRGSDNWVTTTFPDIDSYSVKSSSKLKIFSNSCSGGSCSRKPKEAPFICASSESNGSLIPHEKCNKFYKCDHNRALEFTCHKGTMYNSQTKKCEWASDVECGDRLMPDIDEGDTKGNGENTNGNNVEGENIFDHAGIGKSGTHNRDPREALTICARPESSGTLIAHKMCNKFYECYHNKPEEFTCLNNTFYNPYTEKCDLLSKAECGDRLISDNVDNEKGNNTEGDNDRNFKGKTCNCDPEKAFSICANPGSNGTMIAHQMCNKYYQCNLNRPVELTCPHGMAYNPHEEKCDWSNKVECGNRLNIDTNNNELHYYNGNIKEDNNNISKNNDDKASSICASPGSSGTLIAHKNCNKFYKCDHNRPVEFTCHRGTAYNPYIEKCDWSSEVKCGDRLISDTDSNGSKYNNSNDDKGIIINGGNDYASNNNHDYNNDSKNNGSNNNDGTHNGDNNKNNNSNNGGNNNGGNNNNGENKGKKRQRNSERALSICASPDSNGILTAHKKCNKFYKCMNNIPVEFTCHKGMVYNPYNGQCDWPSKVDCGDRLLSVIDENRNNENFGFKSEGNDNCGEDNANGNNDCNNKSKNIKDSNNIGGNNNGNDNDDGNHNGDNNEYNHNNGGSNNGGSNNGGKNNNGKNKIKKRQRNSERAHSICASPGSNGILTAHKKCNKFYKCINNIPAEFTCHKGTVYNIYNGKCDWPSEVDCGDRLLSVIDDNKNNENLGNNNKGNDNCNDDNANGNNDCNKKSENNKDSNNIGGNNNGNNNDDGINNGSHYNRDKNNSANREDSNNNGGINNHGNNNDGRNKDKKLYRNFEQALSICTNPGSNGTLIAHKYCNKFYKCDHHVAVEFTCHRGAVYNPYIEKCEWSSKVECGDRLISETDDDRSNENDNNNNRGIDIGGNENVNKNNNGSDNDETCHCDPKKAPYICASASSSGMLIAHEICNKFYQCNHNRPVEMTCHIGTFYNPYKEICDEPSKVECGDRLISDFVDNKNKNTDGNNGRNVKRRTCNCDPEKAPSICANTGSNGTMIAHKNCDKFYKCDLNRPIEFTCPYGTLYNPYKEKCDWSNKVECGDRLITNSDSNILNYYDTSLNGRFHNVIQNNDGYDNDELCNCKPEKAPFICASPGSKGTLIAHEICNKFYRCDHNKPVEFTCHKGKVFNPYKEKCDLPSQVECGDRLTSETDDNRSNENVSNNNRGDESFLPLLGDRGNELLYRSSLIPLLNINDNDDSNNDGNDPGENNNNGTCNCNPKQAPFICANPGSSGTMIAHEECNKYYKCDHNKPEEFTCSKGSVYNPYKEICDKPSKVECGDRMLFDLNDNESNENHSKNDKGNDNGGNISDGNNNDDNVNDSNNNDGNDTDENDNDANCNCNPELASSICANPGSNGTLIAHETCNKYYKCYHNNPVVFTCPNGRLYNPYKEICDWESKVQCGDRLLLVSDDNASNDNDINNDADSDNNGNVNDTNGIDNVKINSDDRRNDDPEQAPSICANPRSNDLLIAHEKCNKFYKCAHNIPVEFTCPNDMAYNPYKEKCDEPSKVDCGNRLRLRAYNNISSIDVSNNEDDNNDGNDNSGNDNNDNFNDRTCNCNPEDAPLICALPDSSGILVAHKMCNKFYKCNQNKPVEFTCRNNWLYNPYKEICDWPSQVECGDRLMSDSDNNESNNNYSNVNGDENNDGNDRDENDNDSKCNCDPEKAPYICSKLDSNGTLIAHEKCNKFYKCEEGKPVEFTCPDFEVYDPYKEKCDLASEVDCGDRLMPSMDDNGGYDKNYNNNGCNDNSGTCNWIPEKALTICANPDSNGTLIAHKMCNKYYKCKSGKALVFSCPKGLIFNPYIQKCDSPNTTACGNRLIPDADDNENNNDGNNNDDTCNCNPEDAPSICANPDSSGILVAHEICNKFYKCDRDKPVEFTCPQNTFYNPYKEKCDRPSNVECGSRKNPDFDMDIIELPLSRVLLSKGKTKARNGKKINDNPKEAAAICATANSDGIFIAHESCNLFYMCGYGKPIELKCPQDTIYNPVKEKCDWGNAVQCSDGITAGINADIDISNNKYEERTEDNDTSRELKSVGNDIVHNDNQALPVCSHRDGADVFIIHKNCNQYYRCIYGTAIVMTCEGDNLFNPLTNKCDWPINVDCGTRIKIESDANCACNPKNAPALCARQNTDGKLIAHENCNQFYVCQHGHPEPRYCTQNQLYNIEKEECDLPENVDCSTRFVEI